jgi:spermidine synthase
MKSRARPKIERVGKDRSPAGAARFLLVVVFYTNLLSLGCQILWMRQAGFLFGTTHGTFSAVLSVFLLGLALGARHGGRMVDRIRRPLRYVALLELALGAWCLISLPLLKGVRFLLLDLTGGASGLPLALLRFSAVLLCLLPPAFCIGSVFPAIVRMYSEGREGFGGRVSVIYALDTLGAALGALLTGFVLVPIAGLRIASFGLGAGALLLGLILLRLPDRTGTPKAPREKDAGPDPGAGKPAPLGWLLTIFFFSGMAALLLETGWNRFFYIMSGTSVFSLATVLAAFLAGIGAGSWVMRARVDRLVSPLVVLAYLELLIAVAGVMVFRFEGIFERLYFFCFSATDNFYIFQGGVFLSVFLAIFLATLPMGANFPLVVKACSGDPGRRGRDAGRVFFVNTLGAVAGAFIGEFLVIPHAGFRGLMLLTVGLYGAAGFASLWAGGAIKSRHLAGCGILAGLALLFSPMVLPWELPQNAVYYHGIRFRTWQEYRAEARKESTLYRKDGYYGQVTVVSYMDRIILRNNGKTDGSTGFIDSSTQVLLGLVPVALHPAPGEVALIGLGGGFTLKAAASLPDVRTLTQVEIDPLVVEAARLHFGAFNNRVLEDPRVTLVIDDGRNYIDRPGRGFDVIISEPPNIWVSGVSGLFTEEFYKAAAAKLKPGGLLCQWLPLYEMGKKEVRIALATLRRVFPSVHFWTSGYDGLIVAAERFPSCDRERVLARLRGPRTVSTLAELGLTPESFLDWLERPDLRTDDVDRIVATSDRVNRDDRPVLEFMTARNLFHAGKKAAASPAAARAGLP